MSYELKFEGQALSDTRALDQTTLRRLRSRIDSLAENANDHRHEALRGPLRGLFKFRVGDYRVIYRIESTPRTIVVMAILHRSIAYRQ